MDRTKLEWKKSKKDFYLPVRALSKIYKAKFKDEMRKAGLLEVFEFIRRFLQNVLPSGFMKIRYYGFLHPSVSTPLEDIRKILEVALKVKMKTLSRDITNKDNVKCSSCEKSLKFILAILPNNIRIVDSGFT